MQNQPPLTILVMGFCFPLLDLAFFLVVHIGVFVLRQDGKATKAGGKADARPGAHVTPAGTRSMHNRVLNLFMATIFS
jgi:hypothetical protein